MATKSRATRTDDDYLALVQRFPVRRLRSEAEHAQARKLIRELMLRGDDDLSDGEGDYLHALARFVEDYERQRFARDLPHPTPRRMIIHLMEQRRMRAIDLARVIGSTSAATMLLNGDREPSKAQIRKLAQYFGVTPAVFL